MNLNEWSKEINQNAVEHGWWDAKESEYTELKETLKNSHKYLSTYADGQEVIEDAAVKAVAAIDALEKKLSERPFGDIAALCHSELSEALEEYRNDKPMLYYSGKNKDGVEYIAPQPTLVCDKPEGIATEMADCIIRILDWCGHEGIDIEEIIRIKHEYNKTRPYKHGGKKI